MNGKKVRRASRRIKLRHLAKRLKESGTFDPAVFESPPQGSVPPQDVTQASCFADLDALIGNHGISRAVERCKQSSSFSLLTLSLSLSAVNSCARRRTDR